MGIGEELSVVDLVHKGGLASTLQSLRKSIRGASYDVLQSSLCGQVGELDIPLCQMVPMTTVRSPLRSNVEKLKAEFVTGYGPRSACFYVCLKSFSLVEKHVQPADCGSWSEQWQVEDRKFEALLSSCPEFAAFSNKFFFVWDGNHRHTAWCEVIFELHPNKPNFHVPVRAVVIEPSMENRHILLNAMSDWNRYVSNFQSFLLNILAIEVLKHSSAFIFSRMAMNDSIVASKKRPTMCHST